LNFRLDDDPNPPIFDGIIFNRNPLEHLHKNH